MGNGYLEIKLFLSDSTFPVGNTTVIVKRNSDVLYTLTTDVNGITQKITLDAPDKATSLDPDSKLPRYSKYDVEVPAQNGKKRVIVHGVEVFDEETSILPIQMHPSIEGGTDEENTDEIFIPDMHGVDENDRGRQQAARISRRGSSSIVPAAAIPADEVSIPTYITVHLGSPNALARNVRVPFADYIKNVASADVCQGVCSSTY